MASFLNATLPSDDEEDESYDPTTDKTAEPEDRVQRPKRAAAAPGRRGCVGAVLKQPEANVKVISAVDQKRKAKASALYESLKSNSDASQRKLPASTTSSRPVAVTAPVCKPGKRKATNPDLVWMRSLGMAPPAKRTRASDDLVSVVLSASTTNPMRLAARRSPMQQTSSVQSMPPPAPRPQPAAPSGTALESASDTRADPATAHAQASDDATARAASCADQDSGHHGAGDMPSSSPVMDAGAGGAEQAATGGAEAVAGVRPDIAAIAAAALGSAADGLGAAKDGVVKVVETRRFAGREVQIARELKAGSKAAEAAQARATVGATGLDAVLQQLSGAKKASTMDKSRDDWSGFKETNKEVDAELEGYKKSGDKYLDKQAFLKKAELTQYEKERDARLAGDIRSRGRL